MKSIQTVPLSFVQLGPLVRCLSDVLTGGSVVSLEGELGAGKTTLVSEFSKTIGLSQEGMVTSPTYVLHHCYPTDPVIHHLDLYRLDSSAISVLGFDEFVGIQGVTFIEWYQRAPEIWSGCRLNIEIKMTSLYSRQYSFDWKNCDLLEQQNEVRTNWERFELKLKELKLVI